MPSPRASLRVARTLAPVVLIAALLAIAGCERPASEPSAIAAPAPVDVDEVENGAISLAPVAPEPASPPASRPPAVDWTPPALDSGVASLACELDYSRGGDG